MTTPLWTDPEDKNLVLKKADTQLEAIALIGMTMQLSSFYGRQSFAQLHERIMNHVMSGQYGLLFDEEVCVGFTMWGELSPAHGQIFRVGMRPLSIPELTGGKQLWFCDVSAPFGHEKAVIRSLFQIHCEKYEQAFSLKPRQGRSDVRVHKLRDPNAHVAATKALSDKE